MPLSLPKAHLIGYFVESLSYGVFLVIFAQCMQVLGRRSRSSDYLVGTAVSLFILATAHLVDDTIRVMDAFTTNAGILHYALKYYTEVETWTRIVRGAVYVTATLISDAFILYHSFIVWDRSCLIIAIPSMLFLANIAFGIFWMHALAQVPNGGNFFTGPLSERLKVFYAITLGMNVVCTCLIALKIWKIQRAVAPFLQGSRDKTSGLMPIIVESCCIYSLFLVIVIATYSANSVAVFIFLDPMCSVIGIVFSSLIARVGSGLSHRDTHITRSHTTARGSRRRALVELPFAPSSPVSIPNHDIRIALSQTVNTHIDGFAAEEFEKDIGSPDAERESFHAV